MTIMITINETVKTLTTLECILIGIILTYISYRIIKYSYKYSMEKQKC